jgi:hypothetical protein
MFLQNVSSYESHMASHLRRRHFSLHQPYTLMGVELTFFWEVITSGFARTDNPSSV